MDNTQFGSLNHVTELEVTIDKLWNGAEDKRGDDIQLESLSDIDGVPGNGVGTHEGKFRTHIPGTIRSAHKARDQGVLGKVLGKIHVRTDVEVEESSVISIASHRILTVSSRTTT